MLAAVIPCYLLLRLFQWMLKKPVAGWEMRLVIASVLAYVGVVALGAWGMADGGPLQYQAAALGYAIPTVLAGLIEAVRLYRRERL